MEQKHLESITKNIKGSEVGSQKAYVLLSLLKHLRSSRDWRSHVILRRKSIIDDLIYTVSIKEYIPKPLDAHIETGHAGQDKMFFYIKKSGVFPETRAKFSLNVVQLVTIREVLFGKVC